MVKKKIEKETGGFCIDCIAPAEKAFSLFKGLRFEAYQCPKCKKKFFSEEQATTIARTIDALRLKEKYPRQIVAIGHSRGLTLPKDIVEFFGLDRKGAKVVIVPNIAKKTIELRAD